MRRAVAVCLCLVLLSACNVNNPNIYDNVPAAERETISKGNAQIDLATEAAASPSAAEEQQTPVPETVLPMQESSLPLYAWTGLIPDMPQVDCWAYEIVSSIPRDLEMEALLKRLWEGAEYKVDTMDGMTDYRLPQSPHGKFREDVYVSATQGEWDTRLSYYWDANEHMPRQSKMKISYAQAMEEATDFFKHVLGTDKYVEYPLPQKMEYDIDTHELIESPTHYELHWGQRLNTLPVNEFGLRANRINEGINQFWFTWAEIEDKTEEAAPEQPITFEQALYAMNYHRAKSGENDMFNYCDEITGVDIVYTLAFDADWNTLRPAWRFTLRSSTGASSIDHEYFVDMQSGELWNSSRQGDWRPSPFTQRSHSEVWRGTP